jgi:hypothetical protein
MQALLLFAIGASIGALASVPARTRTHRARFNLVATGIFGALLGGIWLARDPGGGSLAIGAAMATICVTALVGLRHWLVHRG